MFTKQTARILRLPEVKRRTGLSTTRIYERMAQDEFPRQVPLGANTVGWIEAEIQDWIADRVAERDVAWQKLGDAAIEVIKKAGRE